MIIWSLQNLDNTSPFFLDLQIKILNGKVTTPTDSHKHLKDRSCQVRSHILETYVSDKDLH